MPAGLTPFNEEQVSLGLGHASDFRVEQKATPDNGAFVNGGNYLNRDTFQIDLIAGANIGPFGTVAPGNERWDLVIINAAGSFAIIVGTPGLLGQPLLTGLPAVPAGATPLAAVYVDETGTVVVNNSDITDLRPFFESTHHGVYSSHGGAIDHSTDQMEHDKAVPSDWNSPTTPEDVDALMDELAARTTTLEGNQDFLSLSDTPGSYAGFGFGHYLVRVNSLATGLEFNAAQVWMESEIAFSVQIADASGGGVQTASTNFFIPAAVMPDEFPGFLFRCYLHTWNGNTTGSGYAGRHNIDIYCASFGGNSLRWYAIVFGSVGTPSQGPNSGVMNLRVAGTTGPYYLLATSTRTGSIVNTVLDFTDQIKVKFTWDNVAAQLTIDLESNNTAVAFEGVMLPLRVGK